MLHLFKAARSTLADRGSQPQPAQLARTPAGAPLWLTLDDEPGKPELRFLGVRDNGAETFDRYEVGFEVRRDTDDALPDPYGLAIGPSGNHPGGMCYHVEGFQQDSGEAVGWEELPAPVQRAILGEFGVFETTAGFRLPG
jgi:hypothetical protein